MKKLGLYTTSFTLALGITVAIGAGAPVQNIFQGGQPASASAVNQNFQELADRIDAVPTVATYDYRNYLSTASSKTFSITTNQSGPAGCAGVDTEVNNFVRTPNGANTDVSKTRLRYVGGTSGTLCQVFKFKYTNSPTERTIDSRENYDTSLVPGATYRIENPIKLGTSSMTKGSAFADASRFFEQPSGGVETFYNVFTNQVTIDGTENITVSGTPYTACLKIHTLRNAPAFGGTGLSRVQWLCPGVGEVMSIDSNSTGYTVRELVSITP